MKSIIVGLCLFVAVALSATGVDVSVAVSQSAFSCLAQKGYTYAIIRCFRSSGTVDPNCASNVANAKAAGLSASIYMFPCPKCSSGSTQMNTLVSYLNSNSVSFDTLWVDIEQSQYWNSVSENQAFFSDMVNAGKSAGANIGVYTSSSQWGPIMGSFTAGSSFPLWYAHYDNQESFSDFSAFGGWSSPTMKQYNGNQNQCGAGVDLNWMPGGGSSATSNSGNSNSGNSNSGNSNSGNSGNSGHSGSNSGSGNSGNSGHSGSGNSGSGNSGSGNSGSGNSGNGNSGNGNSNTGTDSGTSYSSSSGSSSSGSGSEFISETAIYSKIGGGKYDKSKMAAATKNAKKLTNKNSNRKNKVDVLIERDVDETVESHFKVIEEKSPKKFF